MKLNISNPETGAQKLFDIDDEKKLRPFFEKRMAQEVEADSLGDEWKGYVFRISGGNDKQGFPMKQGILTNGRVRLLLSKGHSCYRPRRTGERKRKSVRGCIVDANLSVLSLIIRRKGEKPIEGLTDVHVPRRLGPKRASKIRKLFNLAKEDDVRQYVVRRPITPKEGTESKVKRGVISKAPKIQRLITPQMLQHKKRKQCLKRTRIAKKQEQEADYAKLLAQRTAEKKAELARKRRSTRESQSSAGGDEVKAKKVKTDTKPAAKPVAVKKDTKSAKVAKAAAPAKGGKSAPAKAAAPLKGGKAAPAKEAPKTKAAAPAKDQKKPAAASKPAAQPAKAAPAAKKAAPKKK